MRRSMIFLLILLLLPLSAQAATLTADAEQPLHDMSATLYGLFFEDINHAADGGLYAEMLQNRSFEYEDIVNPQRHDHYTGWRFPFTAGAKGTASVMTERPLNENNPTYIQLEVTEGSYRLANQGYSNTAIRGGIRVEQGRDYRFSIYLRSVDYAGVVEAAMTDRGANALCQPVRFIPGADWQRFDATFTADVTADCYLTLALAGKGRIDLDMASLMPADCFGASWPGGGLRSDLVEALMDLHPRFLRFPGGCVAEGSYYRANFYNWKDTIGPVEQRKENFNTWGYMQSYGLGYFEYFCLAEALGAQPLPVVHAGLLCQARDVLESPLTVEETRAYAQDILDLIQFATGDISTPYGAIRAQMGHPEPFVLNYLAIGNENWGTVYFDRYAILSAAVKEAYPHITCIVAAGPVAEGALIRDSWNTIRSRFADSMVDEHYYMDSQWFLHNTHRYDTYPRTTPVFLGEFAAHESVQGGKRPNNLYSALCEAAYLTGIERNSDVVQMCCYAPLLARNGMQQWTPNLIWFDQEQVVKTPNYYVQQMFASTLGTQVIASNLESDLLYHVVTRTPDTLYVKLVSLSANAEDMTLSLAGVGDCTGIFTQLSGAIGQQNTFANPDAITPISGACAVQDGQATLILPPYSVTVLSFPLS